MSRKKTSLIAVLLAALAVPSGAALFVVDQTLDLPDLVPGDGKCELGFIFPVGQRCTLRAAVQEANALPGADVIIIPNGWHLVLTRAGRDEDGAGTGDLDILEDVGIGGFSPPSPAARPTVDGGGIDRVFHVHFPAVLTIANLQITGGVAAAPGDQSGGGILDDTGRGLDLVNCRIYGNTANHWGGGLYADLAATGASSIDACEIEGNRSELNGTAIWNYGTMVITGSSIFANRDLTPGNFRSAVHNRGGLTIRNSTLSNNDNTAILSFDDGATSHSLSLRNVTIVENGVGLDFEDPDSFGSPNIKNSILAHNSIQDCFIDGAAIAVANNNNLDSDGSCGLNGLGPDLPNTDPLLGPFGLAGGTTHSYVPGPQSPVIDAGNNVTCVGPDQRNVPRPLDGDVPSAVICDIGAVEVLPCDTEGMNLLITNTALGNGETAACHRILAGPAVEVQPGAVHTFRVRDSVALFNGFTVRENATFSVVLDPETGSSVSIP